MSTEQTVTTIHWNSEYIPHEPQPKQLAFLMLPHKEAFYGGAAGGGKCLTSDHEVLTTNGWVSISLVEVGEAILSWKDGKLSWERVAATHSYDYEGKMLSYEGRWSFLATPNHKWKARWETSNDKRTATRSCKWRWVEASELRPNMKVPAGGEAVPPLSNRFSEDEAELLGWWLSEGSGFIGKFARISQVKKKTREQIISLIERLGYRYKVYEREIRVEWKPPVCGTDCYDKFIPREYLHDASRLGLLRGLLGGDGYIRRDGWEYSSSSKQLAENVHELAVTLGLRATINPKTVSSGNPHWVIAAYPKKEWTVSPEPHQLTWKDYKGKVYCVTVPTTGVFFVRRGGGVHVTGNSDALLMAALQYVDIPGYSAILFRRTLSELKLNGALLDRAHSWLAGRNCTYVAGEHCLTPDTEVLTESRGWVPIAEVLLGEDVATLNPQTRQLTFDKVTELTKFDYSGDIHQYWQKNGLAFSCTPNHRVLHETVGGPGLRYKKADEVPKTFQVPQSGTWNGVEHPSEITFNVNRTSSKPITFEIGDWMEYLGWWLAEGSTISKLARVTIAQEKLSGRKQLTKLHKKIKGNFFKTNRDFNVVNRHLCDYLRTECSASALTKRIPVKWKRLAPRLLERLLFGFVGGDGTWKGKNSAVCWTVSKQLADDLAEIAVLCGWVPQVGIKKPSKSQFGTNPLYAIHLRRRPGNKVAVRQNFDRTVVKYAGPVYCLTVPPNSNFLIRHKGRVCFTGNTYYFPTRSPWGGPGEPAKVAFGYMGIEGAKARYQSAEFQFAGFDELTHYPESDYTWLFSRLRKVVCSKHPNLDDEGSPIYTPGCRECEMKQLVPIRLRGASNPGNIGHKWVKERFRIEPVNRIGADGKPEIVYIGNHPERPFIPATVIDNKFIDQKAYLSGLDELDPLTKAQMKKGDWGASLDARFKAHWFATRRYYRRNEYYCLGSKGVGILRSQFLKVFSVVDPAASGKEGPGDKDRYKKPNESYTVVTTFGLTSDYNLLILDMVRAYIESPDIVRLVKTVFRQQKPQYIICEASGVGKAVYQALVRAGLPVKAVYPHTDKVVRSTDAQIRAEKGQIWLPAHPGPAWLKTLEDELFSWIGHPYETDDIIDTISYAATDVSWEAAGEEQGNDADLPADELIGQFDIPSATPSMFLSTDGPDVGMFGGDYYRGF